MWDWIIISCLDNTLVSECEIEWLSRCLDNTVVSGCGIEWLSPVWITLWCQMWDWIAPVWNTLVLGVGFSCLDNKLVSDVGLNYCAPVVWITLCVWCGILNDCLLFGSPWITVVSGLNYCAPVWTTLVSGTCGVEWLSPVWITLVSGVGLNYCLLFG